LRPKTKKAAVLAVCSLLENSDKTGLAHFLQTTGTTPSHKRLRAMGVTLTVTE
jgi:hypothetical protein